MRVVLYFRMLLLPEMMGTVYVGPTQTKRLLGRLGERVLAQVSSLVQRTALARHWPLARIEVRHTRDAELTDWEYVLVVLVFHSYFEEADRYLKKLYSDLDALAAKLSDEERTVFQRLIFFDVATVS